MAGVSPARQAITAQGLESRSSQRPVCEPYSSERRADYPSDLSPEEADQEEPTYP